MPLKARSFVPFDGTTEFKIQLPILQQMAKSTIRTAVIDDHIVPYRVSIFNHVSQQSGIDLKVFYSTRRLREREWDIDERDLKYKFHVLSSFVLHLTRGPYHEPRSIIFPITLITELIRFKPDVVVGYAFSIPAMIGAMYCILFQKAYVSWATGTPHTEKDYSTLQKNIRRKIVQIAKAYITASNQGAVNFVNFGVESKKIHIVLQVPEQNFIEQCDHHLKDNKTTYTQRNNLSAPIVLFVGFLSERKGVGHLLEAFSLVHSKIPSATLLLAGNGPLQETLKTRCKDLSIESSVHFAGFIQPSTLPELYAGADVFVLPSMEDNFGVVLAEAAACGLPLLSSSYAGASEHFIEPGKNGHIVKPEDHHALAEAIFDLLLMSNLREMRAISRQKMIENPISKQIEHFIDAIKMAGKE